MIYFHQDVFANLYSKFHPWARVIDTQWLPQGHSTQTHSLTRYNQEKKQLVPTSGTYCKSSSALYLWKCCLLSTQIHLGLTELTKAPLWTIHAPVQPLIKAASNEGSLIDTAGLASPPRQHQLWQPHDEADDRLPCRQMTGRHRQTTTAPRLWTIRRSCHTSRFVQSRSLVVCWMFTQREMIKYWAVRAVVCSRSSVEKNRHWCLTAGAQALKSFTKSSNLKIL